MEKGQMGSPKVVGDIGFRWRVVGRRLRIIIRLVAYVLRAE